MQERQGHKQLTDAARELIAPSQKDIDNFVDGILQEEIPAVVLKDL